MRCPLGRSCANGSCREVQMDTWFRLNSGKAISQEKM